MHHPVKLLKLESSKIPDFNPRTRTKWLYECAICSNRFPLKHIEVDHITGGHSLSCEEELTAFYNSILNVTLDDLQILCKPCHEIKTHTERNPGMTWEEAVVDKQVIAAMKKPAAKQKAELASWGYGTDATSNKEKREAIYREVFSDGYK